MKAKKKAEVNYIRSGCTVKFLKEFDKLVKLSPIAELDRVSDEWQKASEAVSKAIAAERSAWERYEKFNAEFGAKKEKWLTEVEALGYSNLAESILYKKLLWGDLNK